jgi:hypothetical protein
MAKMTPAQAAAQEKVRQAAEQVLGKPIPGPKVTKMGKPGPEAPLPNGKGKPAPTPAVRTLEVVLEEGKAAAARLEKAAQTVAAKEAAAKAAKGKAAQKAAGKELAGAKAAWDQCKAARDALEVECRKVRAAAAREAAREKNREIKAELETLENWVPAANPLKGRKALAAVKGWASVATHYGPDCSYDILESKEGTCHIIRHAGKETRCKACKLYDADPADAELVTVTPLRDWWAASLAVLFRIRAELGQADKLAGIHAELDSAPAAGGNGTARKGRPVK